MSIRGGLIDEGASPLVQDVPILSWVSAGQLAHGETIESLAEAPTVVVAGLPPGNFVALKVEGTSMDRIAPPGSVVLVNRAEKALHSGGFYVIATAEGSTFKRFRPAPPRFEPFSTEAEHPTLFPRGEVKVLGRVRRVIVDL